ERLSGFLRHWPHINSSTNSTVLAARALSDEREIHGEFWRFSWNVRRMSVLPREETPVRGDPQAPGLGNREVQWMYRRRSVQRSSRANLEAALSESRVTRSETSQNRAPARRG